MDDDLLSLCGVTLPEGGKARREVVAGTKPPKRPPTPNIWDTEAMVFEFGGYVARIWRTTCKTCDTPTDTLEGIFTEEVHRKSGSRKLIGLAKGSQWHGEKRREVTERECDICAYCVQNLGFSEETPADERPTVVVLPERRNR